MDLQKLTNNSQQALQQAQTIAIKHGHPEIDGEHLLSALLSQEQGLIPRLLRKT
jgi:ATP-dependent Clp protease ATP-binding subunit ClpB